MSAGRPTTAVVAKHRRSVTYGVYDPDQTSVLEGWMRDAADPGGRHGTAGAGGPRRRGRPPDVLGPERVRLSRALAARRADRPHPGRGRAGPPGRQPELHSRATRRAAASASTRLRRAGADHRGPLPCAGLHRVPGPASPASGFSACPDGDPHSCALYFYTEPGDHIGFHFDTSYYRGARYTVLVGLVERSSQPACVCQLFKNDPAPPPVELQLATHPGTLIFFNGDKLWHSDHAASGRRGAGEPDARVRDGSLDDTR